MSQKVIKFPSFAWFLMLGTAFVALLVALSPAEASAAKFPFQPIKIKRINLPGEIKEATRPLFTNDGKHIMFWFDDELRITSIKGKNTRCLSCGIPNSPRSPGEDLATPFPDGKRVFFGGYVQPGDSQMAVLECSPSVIRCRKAKILPVDFNAAQPVPVPAGGAYGLPQINLKGSSSAKLSQDGKHVGFSDVRSDSLLNMIVARLVRSGDKYTVTDPKVINPAGPTSVTDTNVKAWSDSSALYEFKSFINGGADATYVQVGGVRGQPDIWKVNLATGKRTRLTRHPDWDEDNAFSPDGRLMALWSGRTMHFTDWLGGLLPVRDFIHAPLSVMSSGAIGANKMCHGPMWLLPRRGDQNGTLAGQPILSYAYPNVTVTNNLTGSAQWSPDGTMLALNTNLTTKPYDRPRGKNAPFLLVAKLTSRRPTKPIKPVSSKVGAWAPAPVDYHGALGFKGIVTLPGPGGGSVTLSYGGEPGPGVAFGGQWSQTYNNYSDNGKDFVNGRVAINGLFGGSLSSHLTMSGGHTGTQDAELTFERLQVGGHARSTLDGHTISGPQPVQVKGGACRGLLPGKPKLKVKATRRRGGFVKVMVYASIGDMGLDESRISTQPVRHATVRLGGGKTFTDRRGIALVKLRGNRKMKVTAGDTLVPKRLNLRRRVSSRNGKGKVSTRHLRPGRYRVKVRAADLIIGRAFRIRVRR